MPFCVIVNCFNEGGRTWNPNAKENELRLQEIENRLDNLGHRCERILGKRVWSCNLAWFWYASEHLLDDQFPQIQLREDIEDFIPNTLKVKPTDSAAIADASQFLPLRDYLQRVANHWGHSNRPSGVEAEKLIRQSQQALLENKKIEAMLYSEHACYKAPGYFPALKQRAEAYRAFGDYSEANEGLSRILATYPHATDILFSRASNFFDKGDLAEARRDAEDVIRIFKEHVDNGASHEEINLNIFRDAYLLKAEAEIHLKEPQRTIKTLSDLVANDFLWPQVPNAIRAPVYAVLASLILTYDQGASDTALDWLVKAQHEYHDQEDIKTFNKICLRFRAELLLIPFGKTENPILELQSALWHCCRLNS